jgi:hypothetical protein
MIGIWLQALSDTGDMVGSMLLFRGRGFHRHRAGMEITGGVAQGRP